MLGVHTCMSSSTPRSPTAPRLSRRSRCCLRLLRRSRHSELGNCRCSITPPACPPVNASPAASRRPAHDSGCGVGWLDPSPRGLPPLPFTSSPGCSQGFSLGLDQLLCRLQLLLGKHRPLPVAVALKGQPVGRSWSRRPLDEGTARPIVTLLAPPGDQRRVQTLASTDGADCSRLSAGLCLVDLSQDVELVLHWPRPACSTHLSLFINHHRSTSTSPPSYQSHYIRQR